MTNQRGTSLIEILVATAVMAVISVVLLGFLADKLVQHAHQSSRDRLLVEAQQSLDNLMNDVRHASNAEGINRWEDPNGPDGPFSWESSQNTLVLASPVIDNNNDFIYLDPFAYITHKNNLVYFVENGTLYRRMLAADVDDNRAQTTCPAGTSGCPADTVLADNVETLLIRYINDQDQEVEPSEARAVEATLRLEATRYNRTISVEYANRGVFRNE